MDKKSFGCGCAVGAGVTLLLTLALSIVGCMCYLTGKSTGVPQHADPVVAESCPTSGDLDIAEALKPIRRKHKLPAIAGAIVTSEGVVSMGAVGVRKAGVDVPVTIHDKWHLGSDTKAMTATAIARLIEQGHLKRDTTLSDVFPDMMSGMHPTFRVATIRQLLSHRAGLKRDLDWWEIAQEGSLQEQRLECMIQGTSSKPKYMPDDKCNYSNLGYVIAGAIVERITKKSCEQSIRELLFDPLEMDTAGFGNTGMSGEIDQPWPHRAGATPVVPTEPTADNPPVIGSAGRVSCSIADWGEFIADQLRGARGNSALLKSSSYKMLHTPPQGSEYALGWGVVDRAWGGGLVLTHCGCNTMNYANVWIAPQRNFALLVCINQGDSVAAKASDEAIGALLKLYQQKPKQDE